MSLFAADKLKSLDFIGRAFVAFLFAQAIPGKVTGFAATVDFIASRGIPEPLASLLLLAAIVVLIAGSVLFVFGSNLSLIHI